MTQPALNMHAWGVPRELCKGAASGLRSKATCPRFVQLRQFRMPYQSCLRCVKLLAMTDLYACSPTLFFLGTGAVAYWSLRIRRRNHSRWDLVIAMIAREGDFWSAGTQAPG